jgi:hypothetical protein
VSLRSGDPRISGCQNLLSGAGAADGVALFAGAVCHAGSDDRWPAGAAALFDFEFAESAPLSQRDD